MNGNNSHYTHDNNPYLSVPGFEPEGPISPYEILNAQLKDPLELEIGFGRGRFIRDRAIEAPKSRILGIETKRKLVYLCAQKAQKANLTNLVVRFGDARDIIRRMEPDGCLSNVFVNFPDPWWKARHQKRMVVTDTLTEEVVRLLAPGGHYFVQTDVDFRADIYHQVLLKNSNLEPVEGDGRVDANPFDARSSRERRAEELGMPIFRLLFRRK